MVKPMTAPECPFPEEEDAVWFRVRAEDMMDEPLHDDTGKDPP